MALGGEPLPQPWKTPFVGRAPELAALLRQLEVAVIGREFDLTTMRAFSPDHDDRVVEALDEAEAMHVIETISDRH